MILEEPNLKTTTEPDTSSPSRRGFLTGQKSLAARLNADASDDVDADAGNFTPAADDPSRGVEVYAPVDQPFEKPAETVEIGQFYLGVEERLPELAERDGAVDQKRSPKFAALGVKDLADKKAKKGFSVDRRDFMKLFSLSSAAAATACIERPLEKAIPYVQQPVDQWPGEPVYYATTCGDCSSGCGVMVKTREGRPVKVEGLPDHPISKGKLCAVGQGTLQGLFHPERPKAPRIRFGANFEPVAWNDVFEHLGTRLGTAKKIGILTSGATGNRHTFFKEFLERMGSSAAQLYTFEPNGLMESIAAAHKSVYGVNAMPRADLDQARVIVGIGADFLDVGTSLVYHIRGYTDSHAFKAGVRGRHYQFESMYTMTGAKADDRFVIPPGSETLVTLLLARALLENKSSKGSSGARTQIQQVLDQKAELVSGGYDRVGIKREQFDTLAAELLSEPSIVMCAGSGAFDENATNLQLAAIMVNELIGAYETTLHLQKGWMVPPVVPGDVTRFLADVGTLDALIVIDANPIHALPPSYGVRDAMKKLPLVVSIQEFPNEVDEIAHYSLNGAHYLESWGDEQPVAGFWSARQPTVRMTSDARQAEEILMWVAASMKKPLGYTDYRDFMKKKWQPVYQLAGSQLDFDLFFNGVLKAGYVNAAAPQAVGAFSGAFASNFKYVDTGRGGLRLIAPIDYRLHDGRHAHKPIMQEVPHALTTITWDTWVAIAPATAQKLGLKRADLVKVKGPEGMIEVPVYPMPGLHPDAVVVPRGNGHNKGLSIITDDNGANPLLLFAKNGDSVTGTPVTSGQSVTLIATGETRPIAFTQKAGDLGNRTDIYKTVGLEKAKADVGKKRDLDTVPNLYPELPKSQYRWGMAIDLARCTGCGACQTACSTENNVPQVGRDEVMHGRGMYWIKIDRYFSGPVENPTVSFMPMLCQHCNHAPCEAVCPVFATSHNVEGLNNMTYNRCVGTRYCANACPYKIRRFNWFTYRWAETKGDSRPQDRSPRPMNPDVTVRTRGVMEKCSFCYQRVRDGKHRAKLGGSPLADGAIKTACQETCPAEAITFGNLFDTASQITALRSDPRAYLALGGAPEEGEFGIKPLPNVNYLANVSLKAPAAEAGEHAKGSGASEEAGKGHNG